MRERGGGGGEEGRKGEREYGKERFSKPSTLYYTRVVLTHVEQTTTRRGRSALPTRIVVGLVLPPSDG